MRGWRQDDAPIAPDVVPSVIAIEECSSRGTHNPTSTQTCWPKRSDFGEMFLTPALIQQHSPWNDLSTR